MLIVAIPKSASTSLMRTLGQLHGLPVKEIHLDDGQRSDMVHRLHEFHPDIVDLNYETAEFLADPQRIYKQHLPPTSNNIELLNSQPVVVLLRDVDEILSAYFRAFRTHAMDTGDYEAGGSLDDWQREASETGLLDDLVNFSDGWRRAEHSNLLYIDYADLLACPKEVVNEIEQFWGLAQTSEPVVLEKARYTRSRRLNAKRTILHYARRLGIYQPLVLAANRLGLKGVGRYDK